MRTYYLGIMNYDTVLVFDLDDTLYKEINFLKSGYKEIALFISQRTELSAESVFKTMMSLYWQGANVFYQIIKMYKLSDMFVLTFIDIYRSHKPQLGLEPSEYQLLQELKGKVYKVGLITDGRSLQQRSKIEALGLGSFFDDIIISEEIGTEKPHFNNFKYFENRYGHQKKYIYVGDNTAKDFVAPNALGWTTICLLDNGTNIHKQSFNSDNSKMPLYFVNDLKDIHIILKKT
jgi:putative hydrolase of the HAD superfamily